MEPLFLRLMKANEELQAALDDYDPTTINLPKWNRIKAAQAVVKELLS
jgi:hypothetical protein